MSRKAILFYSTHTGKKKRLKHIDDIANRLHRAFDVVDVFHMHSIEEGRAKAVECCSTYDAIIIASGDGTFNAMLDAISRQDFTPEIGYINFGTLGDVGKNFGVKGNYKKACDIICEGKTEHFDICRINDSSFIYMAAAGVYSDIAYAAKRSIKKKIGKLTYYFLAVKEAFQWHKHTFHVKTEEQKFDIVAPFIMALNGRYVGGFSVNKKGSFEDGVVELFAPKPGLFNGLLCFIFHHGVTKISGKQITISSTENLPWCIDGEKTDITEANITVLQRKLRIFVKK